MQQEQKSAQKIDNTQAVWSVAIENEAQCRTLPLFDSYLVAAALVISK
jgi:hypothetical protein